MTCDTIQVLEEILQRGYCQKTRTLARIVEEGHGEMPPFDEGASSVRHMGQSTVIVIRSNTLTASAEGEARPISRQN